MRLDVLLVVPPVLQDLAQKGVQERHVGAVLYRQMHRGLFGDGRGPGVDDYELRGVRTREPVEDAYPGHSLRLRHVVAEEHDGVGVVYVGVGAGLPVGAEGFLEGLARRRGA